MNFLAIPAVLQKAGFDCHLVRKLQVSPGLVSRLLNGKTDISPAMALKLSKVLGRSPESWLLMQDIYDLYLVKKEIDLQNYDAIAFAV